MPIYSGCKYEYDLSDVKYVVDVWSADQVRSGLREARLIIYDELFNDLGYSHGMIRISDIFVNPEYTPSWVYNSQYWYWTMSILEEDVDGSLSLRPWTVQTNGMLYATGYIYQTYLCIRPVIVLSKSVL